MRPNTLRGKEDNARILNLRLKDCVPMPEVERQYYNHLDYFDLKRVIKKDGYDKAYPIRVLWNKKEKVYETFDGIHRLNIMKELGISKTIPAIDDSDFLTRTEAIAKGIKANRYRAPYNPIDLATSLKALGKDLVASTSKKTRPYTVSISEVADIMRMSVAKISQLLQLLKLPEDVQHLIGTDRLKFSHARALTKLLGTRHENMISELAERAVENDMSARELERAIASILRTGITSDDLTCPACRKVMPRDSFGRVCIDCLGKLRSGEFDREAIEKHNEARRRYLKFKAIAERNYPHDNLPSNITRKLEQLYKEWIPTRKEMIYDEIPK